MTQAATDTFWLQIWPSLPVLLGALVLFWIGKLVYNFLTPYDNDAELTERNNAALGIVAAGYYVGLAVALAGVLVGPARTLIEDLQDAGLYGLLAVVLLNLSRYVNDYLILHQFRNAELIEQQNGGTGAVICGGLIATGFIIEGAISGEGAVASALVFFVLGQLALVLGGLVYQWITPYNVHAVIDDDRNTAAGVAFGGFLVAQGMVLGFAARGSFTNWATDIATFATYAVISLILLSLVRIFADKVLLPGCKLSDEVGAQGNLAAALVAVAAYATASLLIIHAL
jgi:uncharacterized membrane protein YjfL (UPF0719 family)